MSVKDRLEKIRAAKKAQQSSPSKKPIKDTTALSGQDDSRAVTTTFQSSAESARKALESPPPQSQAGPDDPLAVQASEEADLASLLDSPDIRPEPSLETPPGAKPIRNPTVMAKPPAQEPSELSDIALSLRDAIDLQPADGAGWTTGQDKVSAPDSGAYDDTLYEDTSGKRLPPPPPQPKAPPLVLLEPEARKMTEIQQFIERINASPDPLEVKKKEVDRECNRQRAKLRQGLGSEVDDNKFNRFVEHAVATETGQRTALQQHAADLTVLEGLRNQVGAAAANAQRKNRQNGTSKPPEPEKATEGKTADLGPQAAAAKAAVDGEHDFSDERPTQTLPPKKKGAFKNLLKTPMTYLATGVAACTGILIYRDVASNDGFQTFANASEWLINDVLQWGPVEVAKQWAGVAYGGIFLSIAGATEWLRHRKAGKDAVTMEAQEKEYSKYQMQRDYIIEEFTKILRKHTSTDAQKAALSNALSEDEELLAYSDLFYQNYYMMERVFNAVNLHDDVRKDFGIRLRLAERALIMTKYFSKLGANLNNRLVRMDQLKEYRAKSPFFRKKLDELFSKNKDGSPSDLYKSLVVLKFDGEVEPQVMPALVQELDRDYKRILAEESAARKQDCGVFMTDQQKQVQKKDGTFKDKALEARKNRKAAWGCSIAMAAAAAIFALWQSCGGQDGPCSTVRRADGQCAAACESLEFRIDENGTKILDRDGNPVKNPFYSWEDCHDTNGRCEDDRSKVIGMDGAPLELVSKDAFGRPYEFQPESADPTDPNFSIDCVRVQCGNQCGETQDQQCPTIEGRPLIGPNTKVKGLQWDTEKQQEVTVDRSVTPYLGLADLTETGLVQSRTKEGKRILTTPIRSAYWRIMSYEERCPSKANAELDLCGPLTEGPCLCPNHKACEPRDAAPPAPYCGDGKINGREECDSSSGVRRGGCGPDHTCRTKSEGRHKSCTCRKNRPPPPEDVCGDGQVTGREQCDTASTQANKGCSTGQDCQANCRCKSPPPQKLGPCPADVLGMAQARDLRDTVRGIFRENAGSLRQKTGAAPTDRVTISTSLTIENGKVIGIAGVSGTCTGTCSTSKRLSKGDILGITGSLDVVGEAAPATRSKCFIPISYSPRQ
jgi:hypothetical protein